MTRVASGEVLHVAFLPNDTSDVNKRDQQKGKRHRDSAEENAPDHADAGRVANERTTSVPSKQGADKLGRNQSDHTCEQTSDSRRSERAANDVNEVSKKRHVI